MNKSGIATNVYTTRYSVGDSFWIMKNNKPTEIKIIKVFIEHELTAIGGHYVQVKYIADGTYFDDSSLDNLCKTKQELLIRVFGVQDE